jgi:hypothetical protein
MITLSSTFLRAAMLNVWFLSTRNTTPLVSRSPPQPTVTHPHFLSQHRTHLQKYKRPIVETRRLHLRIHVLHAAGPFPRRFPRSCVRQSICTAPAGGGSCVRFDLQRRRLRRTRAWRDSNKLPAELLHTRYAASQWNNALSFLPQQPHLPQAFTCFSGLSMTRLVFFSFFFADKGSFLL